MKFRKLDDHKIHCIISQEEMNEKGMRIEDFLDHRDKTEEFLREILAEAKYELDLDDMGHYYSVQMAVMPEGDVSLVISGEEHDSPEDALSDFSKRLQDFKEIMEEAKRKLDEKTQEKKTAAKPEKTVLEVPVWVGFPTLDACIHACHHLQEQKGLSSAAYKYHDTYYLRIKFSEEEHQVAGTLLVVSEFGTEILTDDHGGAVIVEHGTVLCKEHAVETLAML